MTLKPFPLETLLPLGMIPSMGNVCFFCMTVLWRKTKSGWNVLFCFLFVFDICSSKIVIHRLSLSLSCARIYLNLKQMSVGIFINTSHLYFLAFPLLLDNALLFLNFPVGKSSPLVPAWLNCFLNCSLVNTLVILYSLTR